MHPPLILIDGSSYFYRAFHALPPLTNSQGQPTGAIYGVANMVKRLIKDYQPKHLAIVFDAPGRTFRDDWYPEYKANRAPTPPELKAQFAPLQALLEAMGIPIMMVPGVEADDVIGTLAHQARHSQTPILISTGDKDMAQLVNSHITLINTMHNQLLDEQGVQKKFGVRPDQIIDYLTLIGDTADNIPGVPHCGPKTAVKWLTHFHSLDNLLQHADTIPGKIGESLRASQTQLVLSKRLVTIKTDVALPLTFDQLVLKPMDTTNLLTQVQALEFNSWVKELQRTSANNTTTPSSNAPLRHLDHTGLKAWLSQHQHIKQLALQLEYNADNVLCAIQLAVNEQESIHLALSPTAQPTLQLLKPLLIDHTVKKIGHNLKLIYSQLTQHAIQLTGLYADTMLESYLLNSVNKNRQLAFLVATHLPDTPSPITAAVVLRLHHVLSNQLNAALKRVLYDIEIPLIPILANMELHGVLIDTAQLAIQGNRLMQQIHTLEKQAHALAGRPFNLNSPKQLLTVLYHDLQLPVLAKTPKGQASTSEDVLQTLAEQYPLPALILEYRSLTKLVSTYIDALPKHIDPNTQRVHTSYNQAITTTGRLSSSDPNLQNIPVRHPEGRLIRQAFIAPPGALLLTADYSQIELRIMAHLSADPQLLYAFQHGLDIHSATASELFACPLSAVSSEQRRQAKAINFGLIYGMSAFGLAKQLGLNRQDAQHYIDLYFERYPGVLNYMEKTRQLAREQGYVETLFGRRLMVADIHARNHALQKAAERMAINAPMQGTAADIIKLAMIAIAKWQTTPAGQHTQLIMQVHDELVFEIDAQAIEPARATIQDLMENTVTLDIPLCVSIGIAHDWNSAH